MDIYPSTAKPDKHVIKVEDADEYIDVTFGISTGGHIALVFPTTRTSWRTLFEIHGFVRRPTEFPHEMECSTRELLDLVEGTLGDENMLASQTLDYLGTLATTSTIAS